MKRKDLVYKTNKYKFDFQQYETIISFGDNIYNGKISINETEKDQISLLDGFKILIIDLDQTLQNVNIYIYIYIYI